MQKDREQERLVEYRKILRKNHTVYEQVQNYHTETLLDSRIESVLGPALNSFVLWALKEAERKQIKRLYFLARDGYFMYRCALLYCRRWNLPIECRYLSCSRYSIRIPIFHMNMEDALDYICRGGIDVTLDKILNRGGLNEKEKERVLQEAFRNRSAREIIPYAELSAVRERLKSCVFFMECVYERSYKAYPSLKGYLQQEGLLDKGKSALVDSGWVGSMQKTLNMVLKNLGRKERLTGYYWGLYELPADVQRKDYFCYYFSPEKGLREKVFFSNCLFETLFSAPHGMTMGYEKIEEDYVPCYAEILPDRKEFMEKLEKGLLKFAESTIEQIKNIEEIDCKEYRRAVMQILKLFMGKPTRAESELFGGLEFSDDVLDDERQQVAAKMSEKELRGNHVWNKALVMLGIRKAYVKESAWYEGSVARYGKSERYHLVMYRFYKYLLYMRKNYYYLRNKENKNDKEA